MFTHINLVELGTGLTLVNSPLFIYIFGETIRKSEEKIIN